MKPFDEEPAPVIGFLVRFFCGAGVGALLGYAVAVAWVPNFHWLIGFTAAIAIVCGLLAAWVEDEFWKTLLEYVPWWRI